MSTEDPQASRGKAAGGVGEAPRADTIALVDRVERRREVPAALAVGIIVALSLLAGLGAYLVRATSEPGDASPVVTASAGPVFPAPPRSGGAPR